MAPKVISNVFLNKEKCHHYVRDTEQRNLESGREDWECVRKPVFPAEEFHCFQQGMEAKDSVTDL